MVNLTYRSMSALIHVTNMIADGQIGKIRHFDASDLLNYLCLTDFGPDRALDVQSTLSGCRSRARLANDVQTATWADISPSDVPSNFNLFIVVIAPDVPACPSLACERGRPATHRRRQHATGMIHTTVRCLILTFSPYYVCLASRSLFGSAQNVFERLVPYFQSPQKTGMEFENE